ncbi:hypothetical protein N7513_007160 [Penicillium frequentans]|uniref:DUF7779 domain-containing protein n=1 Tax=Penicillium frequentans TaxID=3151616 RepID=A0AAD6CSC6_9EURO|nr:hypothetical protein N7494_006989 [Penicillium glabrum]KAJ5543652.1 hypothetical protein N7513_007160 [Penicillium glabrum]
MADEDKQGISVLHDPTMPPVVGGKALPLEEVAFDLVAIHGLNGDAIETWTHKETKVMWLKDLLPEAIPNIRIMTFGYNARFKNFTAQQDLRAISCKLLAELVDLRPAPEEKKRPIVLVCHSLGGIVAKKALLVGCPEEQELVQQSYADIVKGTPHNGSSLASMGKLLANIVSACSPIRPPRALLGTLQKDSEVLLEITEDFIRRRHTVRLVSFYELEFTSIGPFIRKLVVEQESAILHIPQEITVPQFSDHRNIVRFRSSQDRTFRPVLCKLKDLTHDLLHATSHESEPGPNKGSAIPFDISILPCSFFRGRDGVLEKMKTYFHEDNIKNRRKGFALCGLGGLGKTQTALHYALQNISNYKTGVAFLNATSTASLAADFGYLHDLLQLGDAKDKARSVKSWLSKPENSQWLLVFDNADNLDSVPIQKYFPSVHWGHIIITSRNQAIIGDIVDEGCILDSLMVEDATHLLLDRSGIQHPSRSEVEEARNIADLLGSLPLALVQAGGFIRSRRKSLQDYHRLFLSHRDELLQFSSQVGEVDRTVFTVWEINFKQVEKESPSAVDLLLLFSFLESTCIPELALHRGSSPQRRWASNGEVAQVCAEQEGVEDSLVKILQGDFEFDTAIEKLLSFSLISCNREIDGLRNFSIHPLVQYCALQRLSPAQIKRWRWQAILLICHAFPRNRYLESLNGEIGRMMLPQLGRILSEYDALCIVNGEQGLFRQELASTLLAASRFSDAQWKTETISRTKELLRHDDDLYLKSWLAYRESAILRMSGMFQQSESVLREFLHYVSICCPQEFEITPRFNAQRGELVISFSENLIRQGKFSEAKAELVEWQALEKDCSTLEIIVSRARDISLGKALRFQGLFEEALVLLEGILEECQTDDYFEGTGWFRVLLSEVADLYCELNRPIDAERLLLRELNPMVERGTENISTARRLRMSLVESYLQQEKFAEAESLLTDLRLAVSSSGAPDYTARVNIFRTWVSLGRVSHMQYRWEEALSNWRQALSTLEYLKLSEGRNAGLVRCSIAHALMMLGHTGESEKILEQAQRNMASESRAYWIPIFNSQWHDRVVNHFLPLCNTD